jgi:glyoxalase family protein
MPIPLAGLHHVTAVCSDPQQNFDFYTQILGLRLLKQTVNFDDPSSWHLYYGDTTGRPGTVMTFFAWPDGDAGQVGIGQFGTVMFAIPTGSLGFWIERLIRFGIPYQPPVRRFGERVLAFRDPDGLNLELVTAADRRPVEPWSESPVPAAHQIAGIHGVSLWQGSPDTANFFQERLGLATTEYASNTRRLAAGGGPERGMLDLISATGLWQGTVAVGTIHHVAWAVPSMDDLVAWQFSLRSQDVDVTDVRDRTYFQSIYLDAPGGAMVELATANPGFTVDEEKASLGMKLQLPQHLERQRLGLERMLPPLNTTRRPPFSPE